MISGCTWISLYDSGLVFHSLGRIYTSAEWVRWGCSEHFLPGSSVYTVFTLPKPHFAALGLWSINTDESVFPIPVGPVEKSLCEAPQTRSRLNGTTQLLQTDPLQSLWVGSAWVLGVFPHWCKCPLTQINNSMHMHVIQHSSACTVLEIYETRAQGYISACNCSNIHWF